MWEEGEEEEWKVRVGDRLKEKLERAREGEKHHVLDHEEEHWMQMSGIQIHHVSKGRNKKKNGKKAVRLTAWGDPPSPEAVRKM